MTGTASIAPMCDMSFPDRNVDGAFDPSIRSALGHYVYALLDPTRDRQIFYIGIGGGEDALGNERVLHHFREAREAHAGRRPLTEKVKRILQIWSTGTDVEWVVLHRKLPSAEEAHRLETVLIDVFRNCGIGQLLNAQAGKHSSDRGFLLREQLLALAAPVLQATAVPATLRRRPIMLVNISRTYKLGSDPFEATSRAWKIGRGWSKRSDMIVVGLVNKVSMSVYSAERWQLYEPSRYEFLAGPLEEIERECLVLRSYRAVLQRVSKFWDFGGIVIFEIDDDGDIAYLRGLGRHSEHSHTVDEPTDIPRQEGTGKE